MMTFRRKYYSCSKFADFIRGTVKPYAGTCEEWETWNESAKKKHPIRFYIAEELLDKIQSVIHFPLDVIYEIKYYINNRFITKTHMLESSLEKGKFHEYDQRILHCLFDELVNYVEIDLAWKNIVFDSEERKKFKAPWYSTGFFRIPWRNAESGLSYLKWASELKYAENIIHDDKENLLYGIDTSQAVSAKEILALYNWWKFERVNREDPDVVSGFNKLYEEHEKKGISISDWSDELRNAMDASDRIQQLYHNEDEDMLIRLIRQRRNMWT